MPLRLRLALWYGGMTGLVVILVTLLTYALHSRALYDSLDQLLAGAAQHAAEEYVPPPSPGNQPQSLAAPASPDVAVRILNQDGSVLAASANAAAAPAVDPQLSLRQPPVAPFDPLAALAPAFVPLEWVTAISVWSLTPTGGAGDSTFYRSKDRGILS